MVKYMIKNVRRDNGREVCDMVEISPEWIDPRPVDQMQNIDVKTAENFVNQKNAWLENWIPGW